MRPAGDLHAPSALNQQQGLLCAYPHPPNSCAAWMQCTPSSASATTHAGQVQPAQPCSMCTARMQHTTHGVISLSTPPPPPAPSALMPDGCLRPAAPHPATPPDHLQLVLVQGAAVWQRVWRAQPAGGLPGRDLPGQVRPAAAAPGPYRGSASSAAHHVCVVLHPPYFQGGVGTCVFQPASVFTTVW
jgi:hypothetical protein